MRTIDRETNWFWQQGYGDAIDGQKAEIPDEARNMFQQCDYFDGYDAGQQERDESEPDPRDSDYSRSGIFVHHNCARCNHGRNLFRCPTPNRPGNCGYPYARND